MLLTGECNMFRRREEIIRKVMELVEKFREKGALSPEKAMSIKELGLPDRFEEAMKRRLGKTGVFIQVNGRYYLSEERLKEIKEKFASRKRHW
jgi:lipoate-protein ligase A